MPDSRNVEYYSRKASVNMESIKEDITPSMREKIGEKCDSIKNLLQDKNRKYGNSATDPLRIFSKGGPMEGLLVRCDDKLSRIRTTGLSESGEDQVVDLIGYLVLISIQMDMEKDKNR